MRRSDSKPTSSASVGAQYTFSGDAAASKGRKAGRHGGTQGSPGSSTGNGTSGSSKSPPASKNVSHVPCKFFRQGICQAGDSCPFSHELDTKSEATCKYFQKGNCKFGAKCALVHITPDGRRINKKQRREDSSAASSGQPINQSAAHSSTQAPYNGGSPNSRRSTTSAQTLGHGDATSASSHLPVADASVARNLATVTTPLSGSNGISSQHRNGSSSLSVPVASPHGLSSTSTSHTGSLSSSPGALVAGSATTRLGGPVRPGQAGLLGSNVIGSVSPAPASALPSLGTGSPSSRFASLAVSPPALRSFSFGIANASSNPSSTAGSRPGSFHTTRAESQLFPPGSSAPNVAAGATPVGSISIWGDSNGVLRQKYASLAFEGSAITDDEEDEPDDDAIEEGFEEALVPSALTDLLTPQERERRNSRNSMSAARPSTSDLWGNAAWRPSTGGGSGAAARVLEPIGTPKGARSHSQSSNVGIGSPPSLQDTNYSVLKLGVHRQHGPEPEIAAK